MDARRLRWVLVVCALGSLGATYTTANFVVQAPTPEIAEQVGKAAEHYRVVLAQEWLGHTLPKWYRPCSITVKVGQMGAGGATTFAFDRGEVFGWRMTVQGSLERILDSVLPHEVSHTIFACHFRRPLPRWADEGAATLAENESEQRRQRLLYQQVLRENRRIPLRQLLAIKEYPRDMQHVLTLYAQGHALADFLVETGGKARYLQFVNAAHQLGWDRALQQCYEMENVESLDKAWNEWIIAGSPRLNLPVDQQLAATPSHGPTQPQPRTHLADAVVRSQSPEAAALPGSDRGQPPASATPQPIRRDARPLTADSRSAPPRASSVQPHGSPRRLELPVHSTSSGTVRERSPDAQQRARRDGWTALPLSQAGPSRQDPGLAPPRSRNQFSDFPSPRSELPADDRFSAAAEEPGAAFGRTTTWSDFPQDRTQGEPDRLGKSSALSFSP